MKIKDIIAKIKVEDHTMYRVDFETIGEDLGLSWEEIEEIEESKNERIRTEFVSCHYCTDEYVGLEAYFLDGELICLTHKAARKSNKQVVGWVSQELAQETKDYIKSISKKKDSVFEVEILNLEEDIGDSFKVEYTNQLIHKNIRYKNEMHKVVLSPDKDINGKSNFHEIVIEKEGCEKRVDVRDLEIPYVFKGEFNKYSLS